MVDYLRIAAISVVLATVIVVIDEASGPSNSEAALRPATVETAVSAPS